MNKQEEYKFESNPDELRFAPTWIFVPIVTFIAIEIVIIILFAVWAPLTWTNFTLI